MKRLFCILIFAFLFSGCGAVIQNSIAVNGNGKLALCLTKEGNYKAIVFGGKKSGSIYEAVPDKGDIYITDLSINQLKRLTHDDNPKGFAQWTGDGKRILYLESYGADSYALKMIDEDGSNGKTLIEETEIHFPILSPDGNRVAYFSRLGKGPDASSSLYVLDLATGEPKKLSNKIFASLFVPTVAWIDSERLIAIEVRSDEVDGAFKGRLVTIDMQGGSFEIARKIFYSEAFTFGLSKDKKRLLFNALDMGNLGVRGNKLEMLRVYSYDFSKRKAEAPKEFEGHIMINTWTIPSESVLVKKGSASVIDDVVDSLREGKEGFIFPASNPIPVKFFGYPFFVGKDRIGYLDIETGGGDFSTIWLAKGDGSERSSLTDKLKEKFFLR